MHYQLEIHNGVYKIIKSLFLFLFNFKLYDQSYYLPSNFLLVDR